MGEWVKVTGPEPWIGVVYKYAPSKQDMVHSWPER